MNVIKIEPTVITSRTTQVVKKRRACGYARVSTALEAQESSFETQMKYYENYIKLRDDLEFVGMYSDEGISGTSTKRRAGFNQMIDDAMSGKIDLILTKSISRFARNTVDSLTIIRQLKEKNVEVYFEEQNIYTLDSKGELLITKMASLAQEETRAISENTKWGKRKQFAEGKYSVPYSRFLGYDRGENGGLVINEEQAKIVRQIYTLYLDGNSFHNIAYILNEEKIPTPTGHDIWYHSSVRNILKNEKYAGDAILQKEVTVDFLTKKRIKNDGSDVPKYYVKDCHEPIITREMFDKTQEEMKRRKNYRPRFKEGLFTPKLICGQCGGRMTRRETKYVYYYCNGRFQGKSNCNQKQLREEVIKEKFLIAINEIIKDKNIIIRQLKSKDDIRIQTFINRLKREIGPIIEFDPTLWIDTIESVSVNERTLDFRFFGGIEIKEI